MATSAASSKAPAIFFLILSSSSSISARDCPAGRNFDDANGIEARTFRDQRHGTVGCRLEDVQAQLVRRNVDGMVEADPRPAPRQVLRCGAGALLARGTLSFAAAGEIRLDEVATRPLRSGGPDAGQDAGQI